MLNIGKPVSYVTYVKNTEKLFETSSEVTDSNMEMAAKEVHSITYNNRDIKSAGVNFDWRWNSRRWQAKEGVAAAIDQKTRKYCEKNQPTVGTLKKKQMLRDDNKIQLWNTWNSS